MTIKDKIKRIAIIGLGLIGGSLAKALKVNQYYVLGISRKKETVQSALSAFAIDEGSIELDKEALNNVDLIFIATPLDLIPKHIEEVGKLVKKEIILTDVGSTKLEICNFAKKVLPSNITFIGGHPMAGTEKAGFAFSDISLFKNCAWILTLLGNQTQAVDTLKKIIKEIGAIPLLTSPEKHDEAVALISHLPLLTSIGLCEMVRNIKDPDLKNLALLLASSAYRDMTRIGGGNPEMNLNLLISNLKRLLELLPKFKEEMERILKLVKENPQKLQSNMSEINNWRSELYNLDGKNNLLIKEFLLEIKK